MGKVSMTHPRYNWANLTPFCLLKWTTSWRSLRSYCWTIPYSKYRTKPWEIETSNGRNGGKLFRSSQRNKYMTMWSWLILMNRVINLSYNLINFFPWFQVQTLEFCICGSWNQNKIPITPCLVQPIIKLVTPLKGGRGLKT